MRTIAFFGAGQVGRNLFGQISEHYKIICFADNSEGLQGTALYGIPVTSVEKAVKLNPDIFCICVVNSERSKEMKNQLLKYGYKGEITDVEFLKIFDGRAAVVRYLSKQIISKGIDGAVAELGVYRGDFAALMSNCFTDGRKIHLYDTFEGFPEKHIGEKDRCTDKVTAYQDFSDTSVELVMSKVKSKEDVVIHKGIFPDSFDQWNEKFAFVNIDFDLYTPTAEALHIFWKLMSPGGAIIVHDYNSFQYENVKTAVDEFCETHNIFLIPLFDLHGSVLILKGES